jgi:hypothetical protein
MKTLRAWIIALMIAVGATLPSFPQQPTFKDALLDHLAGKWRLEGTIAGQHTVHDIDAEWVLAHQYLRLREVSREKNTQGEPAYEATVFIGWDQKSSQYACVWLDVYGGISPNASVANAKRDGDEISFLFNDPSGPFHTTFAYDAKSDTWSLNMDATDKGKQESFARTTLTREK